VTVESYYLKLLVETGVVGLVLLGGFLLWALVIFALGAWRPASLWAASVAAAGLGLSLYNVIYPALETQILSMTWWLLFALCLRARLHEPGSPEGISAELMRPEAPQMAGSQA
jgi:O-antigen ligase